MSAAFEWRRVLFEGIVIVVSILAAFAIDASWEARGVRQDRIDALDALREDFGGYLELIADRSARNREDVEAATRLLAATGPGARASDPAALTQDVQSLWIWEPLDLQPGALGALMDSEQRALISDPALRNALREWVQALERLERRNQFLMDRANTLQQYLEAAYPVRTLGPYLVSESGFTPEWDLLLRDVRFEGVIHQRGVASTVIIQDADRLEELASRVLALVDLALGGSAQRLP